MTDTKWTKLSNLQLGKCAEYYAKIEFISHGYDIYSPDIDNRGIDFLAKRGHMSFNIQVKSICKSNYVYILQDKIVLDDNNIVCFLHFQDRDLPDMYIIPSIVWKNPNEIFVVRNYKKPEYGINYSRKNVHLLKKYRADIFLNRTG